MKTTELNEILEALSDGESHSVNDLSACPALKHLSITKLMTSLSFLAEHKFIELNRTQIESEEGPIPIVEAKLTLSTLAFIRRIQWVERSEAHERR